MRISYIVYKCIVRGDSVLLITDRDLQVLSNFFGSYTRTICSKMVLVGTAYLVIFLSKFVTVIIVKWKVREVFPY